MELLTKKEYLLLIEETFGEALHPAGFVSEGSKIGVFYKQVSEEVFHFIMPDRSLHSPKYDVKVFPHSPLLDDAFFEKLPDQVGAITNEASYLSETGFSLHQQWFWCKTREGYMRDFTNKVKPALINHALPFLANIQSLERFASLRLAPSIRKKLEQLAPNNSFKADA